MQYPLFHILTKQRVDKAPTDRFRASHTPRGCRIGPEAISDVLEMGSGPSNRITERKTCENGHIIT